MNTPINIVLVSLNDKFCKAVGQSLSETLDMFNANCEEMIIYDMANPKDVISKCGVEYFKKREFSVVRNCSEYHNTVLSIGFDHFKSYNDLFKNSLIIYIKLPSGKQDKVPNQINYEMRDQFFSEKAQILVDMPQKSLKKCVNLIISKLGEYYENC